MKKIAFLVVYFGKFPVWFPAFLRSCETIDGVDFHFFGDCERPIWHPKNVIFHSLEKTELEQLVNAKTKINFQLLNYYKLCDLKPMLGHLFAEYISPYDYWGHCDIDLVWGDLRKFLDRFIDQGYEVIKGDDSRVLGHCSIYLNTEKIRKLYLKNKELASVLGDPEYRCFDESIFNFQLKGLSELKVSDEQFKFNFYARDVPFSFNEGRVPPSFNQFLWENGKLYEIKDGARNCELMYLHFRNWKDKLRKCEQCKNSGEFYISASRIHSKPMSFPSRVFAFLKIVGIVIFKRIENVLK